MPLKEEHLTKYKHSGDVKRISVFNYTYNNVLKVIIMCMEWQDLMRSETDEDFS